MLQPEDLKNAARARPPAWNLLLATAYLVGAGGAVYAGIRQIGEREAGFSDLLTHHLPMALYGAALAWGVLRLRLAPDGGGFGGMLLATLHAGSLGAGGLAHIWMALGWPGWPASRGSDWIVFSTFPDYALFAALGAALWGPVPGSAIVLRAHRGDVYFGVTLLGMAWILLVALV